jgi:hypothetical protein
MQFCSGVDTPILWIHKISPVGAEVGQEACEDQFAIRMASVRACAPATTWMARPPDWKPIINHMLLPRGLEYRLKPPAD